jgi:multicomponent Na+:H+ antiporter subunit A
VIAVLGIHLVVAAACVAGARRLGRDTFTLAALAPLAAVAWLAAVSGGILDGEPHRQAVAWVPELGLEMTLRLDPFGLLIAWLVAAIGTLVLLYARGYFGAREDAGRLSATLVLFAGSMLGLVSADNVFALFVFWELTTVTSYLLIGLEDGKATARSAALRALLVTGSGGLAMLGGLVLLGQQAGTWSLAEILAAPPSGTLTSVAVALVVVGALTKSAQWPFSFWLPGAMAAPTPISAYLHSATMVKAGVYLLARLSPTFSDLGWWQPVVVGLGLVTMVVGGWRALRQTDLKLLLAHGTVSQLGFMVVLVGSGRDDLLFAGAAVILAHGLFKAALFLVVGIVDHQAHTRDLRRLSGLGRRLPVVAAVAVAAGASMAGVPPLLGFVAKEAAYEALLHQGGTYLVVLAGVVAGSVLTFAYTARFLWGAFGDKPRWYCSGDSVGPDVAHPARTFAAPAVVLAAATVLFGLLPGLPDQLVGPAAGALAEEAGEEYLALWHGFNTALALSGLTVAAGVGLFALRHRLERLQARLPHRQLGEEGYEWSLVAMNRTADVTTGVLQNGSLPVYIAVIMGTMVLLPLPALLSDASWPELRPAESLLQAAVVAVMLAGGLTVAAAQRRFVAALALGVVGFGMAGLFVIQGAPDLALTQLLIETLSLVLFVVVLRHLPGRYGGRTPRGSQVRRAVLATCVGAFVFVFALAAAGARDAPPVSEEHLARSYPEADGANVVNVTLVDFRGWDTLGEITVLVVAALGMASLVLTGRSRPRDTGEDRDAGDPPGAPDDRAGATVGDVLARPASPAVGGAHGEVSS